MNHLVLLGGVPFFPFLGAQFPVEARLETIDVKKQSQSAVPSAALQESSLFAPLPGCPLVDQAADFAALDLDNLILALTAPSDSSNKLSALEDGELAENTDDMLDMDVEMEDARKPLVDIRIDAFVTHL